jgi:hypothetical protein
MSSRKIVDCHEMRQLGSRTELNRTILRGKAVMQDGKIVGKPGDGRSWRLRKVRNAENDFPTFRGC